MGSFSACKIKLWAAWLVDFLMEGERWSWGSMVLAQLISTRCNTGRFFRLRLLLYTFILTAAVHPFSGWYYPVDRPRWEATSPSEPPSSPAYHTPTSPPISLASKRIHQSDLQEYLHQPSELQGNRYNQLQPSLNCNGGNCNIYRIHFLCVQEKAVVEQQHLQQNMEMKMEYGKRKRKDWCSRLLSFWIAGNHECMDDSVLQRDDDFNPRRLPKYRDRLRSVIHTYIQSVYRVTLQED